MPEASLTCIDLWCKAGSSYEENGEEGIAHFLEHMIFKGSDQIKEGEFDLRIEALGGSSNAATGLDDVHFYVLVPPHAIEKAIDLLINLVLSPCLKEKAYSLEREVVLEEIAQQSDQPDEQIFQMVLENCWKKHPYGKPILGNENSLRRSNANAMKKFHERLYIAKNIALAIAGKIPSDIENIINKSELSKLPNYKESPSSVKGYETIPFETGRKEVEVKRLESARIIMAWPIPCANDQNSIMGFDLATSLLGEGRRSRLVYKLREELQIVESIDMDITTLEQSGLIMLEACCLEKDVKEVEYCINQILTESILTSPTKKETERAKQLVRTGLYFSLEVPSQVAALTGSQILWERYQPLLEPLDHMNYWSSDMLCKEVFNQLQPERSFTLIARPQQEE